MTELQIQHEDLLSEAAKLKHENHRLVQICATHKGDLEYIYTFEKGGKYLNLTFSAGADCPIPSVGWLYPYAFVYENEMKELFGAQITGMNNDYNGNFYKTSAKTPFAPVKSPETEAKRDG